MVEWSIRICRNYLEVPVGTFKQTVLIETITASFQLDEIIFELKIILLVWIVVGLYFFLTSRNLEIIQFCSA
jgi:hypothetical protein